VVETDKSRKQTVALQLAEGAEVLNQHKPKRNNHGQLLSKVRMREKVNRKPPTIVIIIGFLACLEGLNQQ
jgi:hypothetical protein